MTNLTKKPSPKTGARADLTRFHPDSTLQFFEGYLFTPVTERPVFHTRPKRSFRIMLMGGFRHPLSQEDSQPLIFSL